MWVYLYATICPGKGYVFVVTIHSASRFPNALRLFVKYVGVPMYFIADPFPSQKSKEVRQGFHKIGTTLRLLEESTPWPNRSELYIGLFK